MSYKNGYVGATLKLLCHCGYNMAPPHGRIPRIYVGDDRRFCVAHAGVKL